MRPRIVETVTAATTAELRAARDLAQGRADIVELRIDGVRDLDLPALLTDRRAPVIVTCRPVWEGGLFDGAEPDRLRLLRRARALGAEFIDVEFRADWRSVLLHSDAPADGAGAAEGIVLSFHDFAGVPADLETIAAGMEAARADIVKIAVTPSRLDECARLAAVGRALSNGVVIGMGAKGAVTRLVPARFNACWTYAGPLAALGQFTATALRDTYGIARVSASPAIYGVVGAPVMHSFSPQLHNAAFREEGIDAVYVPLEAADFADFESFARAFDVRGVSVTAPFKTAAREVATEVTDEARATGAANTLRRGADGWCAANTDIAGFLAPFEGESLAGMAVAVIGRGGAARAVTYALERAGARVTAIGRDDIERASEPWDLLVNATPVGTAPDVSASVLAGRPVRARRVYDLVYNPSRTQLMADAEAAGAKTIPGLPMLVEQACHQFEFWFGRPAPRATYHAAAAEIRFDETDHVRRVR